jgi:hypothetical protein
MGHLWFAYGGPLWTGLSDASQEGIGRWSSGEPATYSNWWNTNGVRNNVDGLEHFVEMNNYVWNDTQVGQLFRGVVEVPCTTPVDQ